MDVISKVGRESALCKSLTLVVVVVGESLGGVNPFPPLLHAPFLPLHITSKRFGFPKGLSCRKKLAGLHE